MGTQIYEPPTDIPKDPDIPPPVLQQLLQEPYFETDQTDPLGSWDLFERTFWKNGYLYNWQTGPGQAGGAQQATGYVELGDELTIIFGVPEIVSDLTPGFGAEVQLGAFTSPEITAPGVYGWGFVAAGNTARILFRSPSWNGAPVGFVVDFIKLYNQRTEDSFWVLNNFGLDFPTFWERWDYDNDEYVLRYANRHDATNILFKFEP